MVRSCLATNRPSAGALFMQMNRNKRGTTLDPMSSGRYCAADESADVVIANPRPKRWGPWASTIRRSPPSTRASSSPPPRRSAMAAFTPTTSAFDGVAQVMCGGLYERHAGSADPLGRPGWVITAPPASAWKLARRRWMARGADRRPAGRRRPAHATAISFFNAPLMEQAALGSTASRRSIAARRRGRPTSCAARTAGSSADQRPAAVQALGEADGRAALAGRPALRHRRIARRQRRGAVGAHRRMDPRQDRRRGAWRRWPPRASRPIRSIRRSRRSTIPTSRRWASFRASPIRHAGADRHDAGPPQRDARHDRAPPALLGEHTDEIRELGYSAAEIAAFRRPVSSRRAA